MSQPETEFKLDEPAATTYTPAGWPIRTIELAPSGKAPKKYGDSVYRFGAALTLSVLLPRRGWTLVKKSKNYVYLKHPPGEPGPPFRMDVAVPTDAECLAIAHRSFARGHSWIAQLGEWPAWYFHEQSKDVQELWRDPASGEMRRRTHRAPARSTLTIGEWGAWQANVTGEGGKFAIGILPPPSMQESNQLQTSEGSEAFVTAADKDLGKKSYQHADAEAAAAAADDDDDWNDWDNDPDDEYTEQESTAGKPIRVTLKYFSASGRADTAKAHQPRAELYAHGLAYDDETGKRKERTVLLAVVTRDGMTTYPLVFNPGRAEFLEPRYGQVTTITLPAGQRGTVPKTVKRFDEMLAKLPSGFSRYAGFGLGLKYEYRFILEAAQQLPGVSELAFVAGDVLRVDGPRLVMGWKRFDQLRKAINTISSRATNRSLQDRSVMVHNEILHRLDSAAFPLRQRKLRPGEIYKLAALTSRQPNLGSKDMDAAAEVLSHAAPAIAKEKPEKLLALGAYIETIALDELIARMEAMMQEDITEERWQAFFMANPFVISLALPYAVFVLGEQAHVGGAKISGSGENIADYLFAQKFTGGLGVVEIKRPSHELVTNKVFRGGIHAPHPKLTSAIAQVLGQKTQLTMNFASKALDADELQGKNVMSVHCVVVIGTTPSSREQRRSFDLFRDAVKNVAVLTFDELLERIRELRRLMSSRPGLIPPATTAPMSDSTPTFEPEVDDDDEDLEI